MSLFSLLSFFAFLVYLTLGIQVHRLDKKARLNGIFFALCLALAIWAFSTTFLFSAPNKETCWFWYRLSAFGWCLIPSLLLHFFLQLTSSKKMKRAWPLLYLP
ncbi:MAG TPA: histidine kinase N-terminal 7TM domain-containing protein, partial [Chroococcales cyanobacterium]